MTEQLKQFLLNNKNSLEEDDFRTLYKNWSKYIDSDDVSDLTDVFLEVGIEPLNYLPEVPAKYSPAPFCSGKRGRSSWRRMRPRYR